MAVQAFRCQAQGGPSDEASANPPTHPTLRLTGYPSPGCMNTLNCFHFGRQKGGSLTSFRFFPWNGAFGLEMGTTRWGTSSKQFQKRRAVTL